MAAVVIVDLGVVVYILMDPGSNSDAVAAIAAVLLPSAGMVKRLWRQARSPEGEQDRLLPPSDWRNWRDWRLLWHPLLLVAPLLSGAVGLGLSTRKVEIGWALLYGLRIMIVVYVAGVVVGLLFDSVVRLVELAGGKDRHHATSAASGENAGSDL
jgi:hypothetical protein